MSSDVTKILIGSDFHVPYHDKRAVDLFFQVGNYLAPDIIVINGDFMDFYAISAHRRDPRRKMTLEDEIVEGNAVLDEIGNLNAPIVKYIEGNHECVSEDTEILTEEGWIESSSVKKSHKVGSVNLKTGEAAFSHPVALTKNQTAEMCKIESDDGDELVSKNHRLVIDGKLVKIEDAPDRFPVTSLMHSVIECTSGISMDVNTLRLLTWLITDGTLVKRTEKARRLQWKLSKPEKIKKLRALLEDMKIPYTFREAQKSGGNKLQPFYICIHGEEAKRMAAFLSDTKEFPQAFKDLNKQQLTCVLETLECTDATRPHKKLKWTTTSLNDAETIQLACFFNNIPCSITERDGSGFENGKLQYHVSISDRGLSDSRKVTVKRGLPKQRVVSIQTVNGTLITRRNGKISVTGNSRLERFLLDRVPELTGLRGMSVKELLQLEDRGWDHTDYKDFVKIGKVTYTHDLDYSGKYIATRSVQDAQHSIIVGHAHRVGYVVEGDATGRSKVGACFGWLGDPKAADYKHRLKANRDWSHGFGIGYMNGDGTTFFTPVPIVNGRCMVEGKLFTA